jgi:hypothetical protein
MLALVAFLALFMAAFAYATEIWASIVFTVAVLTLFSAIVFAIYRTDGRRPYWVGFCVFGCGYATLVFAPWFDENLGPRLLTSDAVIRPLHKWLEFGRAARAAEPGFVPVKTNDKEFQIGPKRSWYIWGGTWENSRRIGNSAATQLWAIVGGALAQSIAGLQPARDPSGPTA